MRKNLTAIGLGLVAAIVGGLLLLVGLHLYADHRLIDDIRADIIRQQMQRQQAIPAPAPAPPAK